MGGWGVGRGLTGTEALTYREHCEAAPRVNGWPHQPETMLLACAGSPLRLPRGSRTLVPLVRFQENIRISSEVLRLPAPRNRGAAAQTGGEATKPTFHKRQQREGK